MSAKFQVVEVDSSFGSQQFNVSVDLDLQRAAELFGKRMPHVTEIYVIDENGCVWFQHKSTASLERAPWYVTHAAGLTTDHIIEVSVHYGGGSSGTCWLDIDGKTTYSGENIHAFHSIGEAQDVADRFNKAEEARDQQNLADGVYGAAYYHARVRTNVYRPKTETAA